jgi:hypothetical protein
VLLTVVDEVGDTQGEGVGVRDSVYVALDILIAACVTLWDAVADCDSELLADTDIDTDTVLAPDTVLLTVSEAVTDVLMLAEAVIEADALVEADAELLLDCELLGDTEAVREVECVGWGVFVIEYEGATLGTLTFSAARRILFMSGTATSTFPSASTAKPLGAPMNTLFAAVPSSNQKFHPPRPCPNTVTTTPVVYSARTR